MFHGSRLNNRTSYSLLVAGMLFKNGFDVVMAEYSDHGYASVDDNRRNMGAKEIDDAVGICDFIISTGVPIESIGLYGQSMGGTIALLLARVRSCTHVITDGALIYNDEMIKNDAYKRCNLSWLYPFGKFVTSAYLRYMQCYVPEIKSSYTCQYMIIQSYGDECVTNNHGEVFQRANKHNVTLKYYAGGHLHGPFLNSVNYEHTICYFFNNGLLYIT